MDSRKVQSEHFNGLKQKPTDIHVKRLDLNEFK